MLSIKNFETQLSSKILQKGREYYESGAVISLEKTEKNLWEAEVQGNETYSLEIQLKKNGEVSECFCDCPVDSDICKHVVATLFAIKEASGNPATTEAKASSKITFDNLLQKISQSEYMDFIKQYASKNKTFKTEFEIFFADKDERINVSENYEKLIKKSIQHNSDGGFVDYQGSYGLSRDIDKILAIGNNFIKNNNYRAAFDTAKPVLKLMMEVITYCDDSNGSIGGLINSAIELIENIAESNDAAIELKEQVYAFLQAELSDKTYFSYGDFGYGLFYIFSKLSLQLNKQTEFIKLIDQLAAIYNDRHDSYTREFLQKEKIAFYEATGNVAESQKLIEENINIVEVRAGLVNKAVAKKDFVAAKKLIADGIKVAQSNNHPGTVANWEKALLQIAVLEKDTSTIRHYAKKMTFDRFFDANYYNQWKKSYVASEWHEVIENHILETIAAIKREYESDKTQWRSHNLLSLNGLAPVYIEEKYWDRLLGLVKKAKQLDHVWQYHPYLSKSHPAELVAIYITLFIVDADAANSRGAYAELAAKMKKVIKDIPEEKEKITDLARSLQLKYPRRPAMVEELNKILK